jgi:hypothetical protein
LIVVGTIARFAWSYSCNGQLLSAVASLSISTSLTLETASLLLYMPAISQSQLSSTDPAPTSFKSPRRPSTPRHTSTRRFCTLLPA